MKSYCVFQRCQKRAKTTYVIWLNKNTFKMTVTVRKVIISQLEWRTYPMPECTSYYSHARAIGVDWKGFRIGFNIFVKYFLFIIKYRSEHCHSTDRKNWVRVAAPLAERYLTVWMNLLVCPTSSLTLLIIPIERKVQNHNHIKWGG